jgi:hypothetical protein
MAEDGAARGFVELAHPSGMMLGHFGDRRDQAIKLHRFGQQVKVRVASQLAIERTHEGVGVAAAHAEGHGGILRRWCKSCLVNDGGHRNESHIISREMRWAILALFVLAGCEAGPIPAKLEFLYRDHCVEQTQIMLYRLDAAIAASRTPTFYTYVHLDKLPPSDPRKSYLTPTILRDGVDLFGMISTSALARPPCRYSRDEVPSADAIAKRLSNVQ